MRVIIILGKEDEKIHLMLELPDKKTLGEVKGLLNAWKWPEAISSIIAKGKFIKKLREEEIARTASELILTDTNAYWDLL